MDALTKQKAEEMAQKAAAWARSEDGRRAMQNAIERSNKAAERIHQALMPITGMNF